MLNESIEQMARMRLTGRERGANRVYRVPPLASALTVASSPSVPLQIRFRKPGIVIAMYGQVQSGEDEDAASTEVRIQIAGTRDIFTDGDSGTFLPFLALFGQSQNWWPLDIPAIEGQDWSITYRLITGGPSSVVPSIMFAVCETQ
jgi:hypothetical protein